LEEVFLKGIAKMILQLASSLAVDQEVCGPFLWIHDSLFLCLQQRF